MVGCLKSILTENYPKNTTLNTGEMVMTVEQLQALKTVISKPKYDKKTNQEIADMINAVDGGEAVDSGNLPCSNLATAIVYAEYNLLSQEQKDWILLLVTSGDGLVNISSINIKTDLLDFFPDGKTTRENLLGLMTKQVSIAAKNSWPTIEKWHVARAKALP
jgi:hypothetical protein